MQMAESGVRDEWLNLTQGGGPEGLLAALALFSGLHTMQRRNRTSAARSGVVRLKHRQGDIVECTGGISADLHLALD
jgi:hypothetical protein